MFSPKYHGGSLLIALSFVEHLQSIALPYLKIWSGLPRAVNPTILFSGKYVDIGLKLKTISGLWKQLVSKQHMQKYSNDPHLKEMFRTCLEKENLGLSSLKFLPTVELELAEASMRSKIDEQQGAFGNTQRHGLGFGVNTKSKERKVSQNVNTSQNRENRKLIASHLQQIELEDQIRQLRTLSVQGNWTNWNNIMNQDVSWKSLIYGMSDNLLKFLLRSTTNTLETRDNLRRWGTENISTSCTLCGGQITARYVLSSCVVSLKQGRYTWRHNCVLNAIKDHVLNH